jgi:hypothetical protein
LCVDNLYKLNFHELIYSSIFVLKLIIFERLLLWEKLVRINVLNCLWILRFLKYSSLEKFFCFVFNYVLFIRLIFCKKWNYFLKLSSLRMYVLLSLDDCDFIIIEFHFQKFLWLRVNLSFVIKFFFNCILVIFLDSA